MYHGNRPPYRPPLYPQQPGHGYPPAPPGYGHPPFPPGHGAPPPARPRTLLFGLLAAVVALSIAGALAFFMANNTAPRSFANGGRIDITADTEAVFVRGQKPDGVRCTAVRTGGQRITLPHFSGWPNTVGGGRGRGYRAVATLPGGGGSLTVTCSGVSSDRLYVGEAPSVGPLLVIGFAFAVPTLAVLAVAIVMRRRMYGPSLRPPAGTR
ncbi:hypothetical protein AB0K11_15340 [Mycobacterium sp. NPDC050551]|uniref:hypothetical protein n=1 Tax=Mycobacterium sp. NPDC050551 TaxID=3155407 RepID=UPI003432ACA8